MMRIHQISIRTKDTARAVAFYRDVVGLKLLFEAPPRLAFFDCGGVRLMLGPAERADVIAVTSSVGAEPRAFWGAYGSSKAALEALLGAYADETEYLKRVRVHIVDPGATRTRMRALAFPGEEPESVKPPEVAAHAIVERLTADAPSGEKIRVDA